MAAPNDSHVADSGGAIPVPRGCGNRKPGGVYFECGLGADGSPVEAFLICPPVPVEYLPFELPTLGVVAQQATKDGPYHVFDHVGSQHYLNVLDFVEEVRRFGMSRRVPKTFDFSKITEKSQHILAHARADIVDPLPYHVERSPKRRWCPKGIDEHDDLGFTKMCAGLWWWDVEGGDEHVNGLDGVTYTKRAMPSFSYRAHPRPAGLKPEYRRALFMALPITRIVVVKAKDDSHKAALEKAQRAHIEVAEVKE